MTYYIINIMNPKENTIKQLGILMIWDSLFLVYYSEDNTFNDFLNLMNVAVTYIITPRHANFLQQRKRKFEIHVKFKTYHLL